LKDLEDADETIWKQWDQVDVRMYYFDIAMNEQKDWKDTINGIWYLQDYIYFFDALRKLAIHKAPASTNSFTCLEGHPDEKKSGTTVEDAEPRDLHKYYQTKPNESHFDSTTQGMPQQSASENRAYHIFSILSWFFYYRDGEPVGGDGKIFCWSTLERTRLETVLLTSFTFHRNSLKNQPSATSTNLGFR
jgi:hypothetical protein